MAAIAFDAPRWYPDSREKAPPRRFGSIATASVSTGFKEGDFVLATSTGLCLASAAPMTVTGLCDHDSAALYLSLSTETTVRAPFGKTNSTTLQPFSSGAVQHYIYAGQFQLFEISLNEAWLATMAGVQAVGISVDATSGLYIATTSLTSATIVKPLDGPGLGVAGDTGKRVVIQFLAANVV